MTVFLFMSSINVMLSILLAIICVYKVNKTSSLLTGQILSSCIFIALGMTVLHAISAISHAEYAVTDVIDGAWRVVDMLSIILMIRLVWNSKE